MTAHTVRWNSNAEDFVNSKQKWQCKRNSCRSADFQKLPDKSTLDHCFWFFFIIIWVLRSRSFHSFWAKSIVKWGEKWKIPEKKHLTTRKQNLACLAWPELGSNPQQWDEERFRALMSSAFNHSSTGASLHFLKASYLELVIIHQLNLFVHGRSSPTHEGRIRHLEELNVAFLFYLFICGKYSDEATLVSVLKFFSPSRFPYSSQ